MFKNSDNSFNSKACKNPRMCQSSRMSNGDVSGLEQLNDSSYSIVNVHGGTLLYAVLIACLAMFVFWLISKCCRRYRRILETGAGMRAPRNVEHVQMVPLARPRSLPVISTYATNPRFANPLPYRPSSVADEIHEPLAPNIIEE